MLPTVNKARFVSLLRKLRVTITAQSPKHPTQPTQPTPKGFDWSAAYGEYLLLETLQSLFPDWHVRVGDYPKEITISVPEGQSSQLPLGALHTADVVEERLQDGRTRVVKEGKGRTTMWDKLLQDPSFLAGRFFLAPLPSLGV